MNDTKRVLLLSHEFPPFLGGVGTVGAQLAGYISDAGYETHVMTRQQEGRLHVPGVIFHDVDVLPKFWFRSYRRALKTIDVESFDTIILNEAAPAIVAGKYFDDATLARCIVLVHGLEVERIYRTTLANTARQVLGFRRAHRRACTGARLVVAASEDMKEKFSTALAEVRKDRIRVMYLGVDPNVFYQEASNYREVMGIDPDRFVLVSGSRIVKEKGYLEMLEAFGELASHTDALWIVCGDGPLLDALRARVSGLGLSDRVMFEGACSRAKLRWIYNSADAYWLVSHYREAFPLSYIEAQLTGLPTLGRNAGGVPEAIAPGENGWLVEEAANAVTLLEAYAAGPRFDRKTIADGAARFSMATTFGSIQEII